MIHNIAKVKDHPGLIRDRNTHAIINTDRQAYDLYMSEKAYREQVANNNLSTQSEINNIKNEIQELKTLITTLINHKNTI